MNACNESRRQVGLALLTLFLLVAGCKSTRPAAEVEMTSVEQSRRLEQSFKSAWFARDAGGDFDIVLLNPIGETARRQTAEPLMHLLHIKVLWRPKKMIRADAPSATNCTLRYVVMTGDQSESVVYNGVGFANVYGSDDQVRVMLSNATLTPVGATGALSDPIGKAMIKADFKARHDSARVKELLAISRSVNGDRATPPARPPTP